MTIQTIRLPRGEWHYDTEHSLGPAGGFGQVFRGSGALGPVAIKRLNVSTSQAAHRELEIGTWLIGRALKHVVPIFDAGADSQSDRYFLVMPICDRSLQEETSNAKEGVLSTQAFEIIRAILAGLSEVPEIVHRDLKPGNVLLHEGVWKIADFGIAKFVEESTSTETLRDFLTASYAAPEQWLGHRSTNATDIYALGCIAHTLLTGGPPFSGSADELRDKHLHCAPPLAENCSPRVASFVSHMLRKAPEARPTLQRCLDVFATRELEQKGVSTGLHSLLKAGTQVAEREAKEEAERQAEETRRKEREALFADSAAELRAIKDRLFAQVCGAVESAKAGENGILLGQGKLQIGEAVRLKEVLGTPIEHVYRRLGWDIVVWALIAVGSKKDIGRGPVVVSAYFWSATLLFADRKDGQGFRWYEVSFWSLATERKRDEPFGIKATDEDLYLALGPVMHSIQVAYGPIAADGEDEPDFANRWLKLLSEAAVGSLDPPGNMPINLTRLMSA